MTNEKFVDVDGIKTRYFEKGDGPVVVLFHGGHFGSHDCADCADDWGLNFDGLAKWFHVFAVDKLGQGHTDNPKRDEDYTMAAVVRHAYGFLKALGLRNVHPVGHSRGAFVVGRLALGLGVRALLYSHEGVFIRIIAFTLSSRPCSTARLQGVRAGVGRKARIRCPCKAPHLA